MSGEPRPASSSESDAQARASEALVLARLRQRMLGRDSGPTLVGRYRLGETLGAGGMAVVLRAYDPQLDREVAIKLVRGPKVDDRLHREARALARLAHPNVVSIFDVGFTGAGELFIAMELVEGETLAQRMARRLVAGADDTHTPLAWMIAAGRGVAAAHRVGLVHRDFKPDNVMIGNDGRVRVADFGLSRAPTSAWSAQLLTESTPAAANIRPDSHDDMSTVTRSRGIVGTPLYMAPEQHRGDPVDARTDVYAFCVVLFEIVYGVRPFAGSSLEALLTAKQAGAPRLRRKAVPAWLSRVITKGLQPQPSHRWPTMDALLEALGDRRIPKSRPLAMGLAAVMLTTAALCAAPPASGAFDAPAVATSLPKLSGLVTSSRVVAGVAAHRDGDYTGAATRYERAFHGAVEGHDDAGARHAAARLALLSIHGLRQVTAAERWIRHARANDERGVEAADDLVLRAEGHVALARGDHPRAAEHFEALIERAEHGGDPIALATALCDAGDTQHRDGQFAAATTSRRHAIALVVGARRESDPVHARAWSGLGRSLDELALPAESRAAHERALALRERHLRPNHPDIAAALHDLGVAQISAGEFGPGQATLARALALYEAELGDNHPAVGFVNAAIGSGYCDARRHDDARMHHERAVAVFTAAWGPEHPAVGGELLNIGRVFYEQGNGDAALRAMTQGQAVLERAFGPDHPQVAAAAHNIGQTAARLDRPAEALVHLLRAAEIRRAVFGPTHPSVAQTQAARAAALRDLGFAEAAVGEFTAAIALLDGAGGFESVLAHAQWGLALALADAGGDRSLANAAAAASLAFHRSRGGDSDENVLEIAAWLHARA